MSMGAGPPPWPPLPMMTLLSFLALAAGVAIGLSHAVVVSGGAGRGLHAGTRKL